MSDFIGIRGSAKEKAEDAYNAKAAALRSYEDEIREFRGVALDTIAALVQLHGDAPVPSTRLREILNMANQALEVSKGRYESRVQRIEEAYK